MDSSASKCGGGDELGASVEGAPPPPDEMLGQSLLGRRDPERVELPLLDPADPRGSAASTPHRDNLARIAVLSRAAAGDGPGADGDEAADASFQCLPPPDDECELLDPLLGPLLGNRDIFERVLLPLLDPVDLAMLGR